MTRAMRRAAACLAMLAAAGGAGAADLDNGKSQYNKCRTCHDVGEGAKNKVGPLLNDIIGRKAASIDGFVYSDDLKALADKGLVWNDENLHKYIEDPKAVVPNGKMVFAGMKDKEDRDDLIAYLKQFTKK